MADGASAVGERARYQQTAMTIERLPFGTHQANAVPLRDCQQSVQADSKLWLPRHLLIVGNAVAIESGVARTAAQRFAERHVEYAFALQRARQILPGEPGKASRRRCRAHIRNSIHASAAQHADEALNWNI